MPTPHEFRPRIHVRANYRLHEWGCTCGATCKVSTRSRVTAELDWWSDHVMPDHVPQPHACTLVPGAYENSLQWTCSCGDYGEPRGHKDERRAWQAHRAHENLALVKEYREAWVQAVHSL